MSSIQDAIAQATAAAQAAAGAVPALAGAAAGVPSTETVQRGAPLSMTDLMQDGGISPDKWLKVDEFGILIGGKKPHQEEIDVLELDFSLVKAKYSIKYGNPPTYEHSYDHRVSTRGESWASVCQKAARVDTKAREYRSADIPLVVVNDIPGNKGEVLAEAGEVLGLTLSTTAWRNWERFLNQLAKAGVDIQNDVVKIKLGHEVRNGNNNTWGVPVFTLITN